MVHDLRCASPFLLYRAATRLSFWPLFILFCTLWSVHTLSRYVFFVRRRVTNTKTHPVVHVE
jgi:hypothetical protein